MRVDIWSDIACPWCHLGKARFERALADFPQAESVEVVYRPFQLDPAAPDEPRPHREALAAKYGPQSVAMDDHVTALGAAEGVTFDFDTVLENNSLLAHRLLRYALDAHGAQVQGRLKSRLMAAHFAEGVDIGDREALAAVAADAGLDRAAVVAFLASDDLTAEVRADLAEAGRLGITAVPTFVFDGTWAVQGGQSPETFLRALHQVASGAA